MVERECRVGSTCAQRLSEEAARGSALVAQARAAADTAIATQKAALDKQAADAIRGAQDAATKAQADLVTWRRKYSQALQSPDCGAWAKQAAVCAMH